MNPKRAVFKSDIIDAYRGGASLKKLTCMFLTTEHRVKRLIRDSKTTSRSMSDAATLRHGRRSNAERIGRLALKGHDPTVLVGAYLSGKSLATMRQTFGVATRTMILLLRLSGQRTRTRQEARRLQCKK